MLILTMMSGKHVTFNCFVILDYPEFLPLYEAFKNYFDIKSRVKSLNKRYDTVSKILINLGKNVNENTTE